MYTVESYVTFVILLRLQKKLDDVMTFIPISLSYICVMIVYVINCNKNAFNLMV